MVLVLVITIMTDASVASSPWLPLPQPHSFWLHPLVTPLSHSCSQPPVENKHCFVFFALLLSSPVLGPGESFAIAYQGGVYMAHCIPEKYELKQMQHKEKLEQKGCCVALSCQRSVQRILEANPASAESAQINLLCCQPVSVSRTSSA